MSSAGTRQRVKQNDAWLRIRDAIRDGVLRPGDRLSEQDLAQRLGVSRTPVREALHRVAQQGLVHQTPAGWMVTVLSVQQATELYQVRSVLEGMAARLAAINRTKEDLRAIEESITRAEEAIAAGDPVTLQQSNQAFHAQMIHASHNDLLAEILANLAGRSGLTMGQSLGRTGRPHQTICEHRELFEAVAASNAKSAEAKAAAHVNQSLQSVLNAMASRHDPFSLPRRAQGEE